MSHTPGPWDCDGTQVYAEHLSICNAYRSRTDDEGNWMSNKEVEANARLIAAAPDLLAACKRLLLEPSGRFVCYCHDPEASAVPCDNCVAAAAITKATGGDDWQD